MSAFPIQPPLRVKQIVCTFCHGISEVAQRAMSIFCPHCHKRLVLEDYTVRGYHAVREFVTCGNIVVEPKGYVRAQIRVTNLIVRGEVHGDVAARDLVSISSTGCLQGDVEAPRLAVEEGAVLRGFVRIGERSAQGDRAAGKSSARQDPAVAYKTVPARPV